MLRIIIIDDEVFGINALKLLIDRLEMDLLIVATAIEPLKGVELIVSYRPDVVFLDVNMPKLNGFQLLERLTFKEFKLVFTTAHQEHAIQAIKHKAFDYLLKPIDSDDLKKCFDNIISEKRSIQNSRSRSILELPMGDGLVIVKQSNIVRLEASGSYTTIFLKNDIKYMVSRNIKYFEAVLDQLIFCRCHQSFIVNLHEVAKLSSSEGSFILMTDGSRADIGKKYKEKFLLKLKEI